MKINRNIQCSQQGSSIRQPSQQVAFESDQISSFSLYSTVKLNALFRWGLINTKLTLALAPLFSLSYCPDTLALLSTSTHNTIKGTAPYLALNGIVATDLTTLLSVIVGDDVYVSDSEGNMRKVETDGTETPVDVISLKNASDNFTNVKALVPTDGASYSLNDTNIIPTSALKDDDGDSDFVLAGNIQGDWKDRNGTSIGNDLSQTLSICSAPYTLTLDATGSESSISTQYGDPGSTTFGRGNVIFKINPATQPTACFAKPDMDSGTGDLAGPTNMWDTNNGFIVQSNNPDDYGLNFPTNGANNLYFELNLGGVSSALTWPTVTRNDITATMTPSANGTSVQVKLSGPTATKPSVTFPVTFELEGKNSQGTTLVKYGFVLKKWFINRGQVPSIYSNLDSYCTSAGYRVPSVSELTNASGGSWQVAQPTSSGNNLQRAIGAGLFSEWGSMGNYNNSGFVSISYWSSDGYGTVKYYVDAEDGSVDQYSPELASFFGACIYP